VCINVLHWSAVYAVEILGGVCATLSAAWIADDRGRAR
jgi:hypothetical protein